MIPAPPPDRSESPDDAPLPTRVTDLADAIAAVVGLVDNAERTLQVHVRQLERGLFDDEAVLAALRRFATRPGEKQARFLLQEPQDLQATHPALLRLAQRLPSAFAFRQTMDPADRDYPSAFVINDRHGYYFRPQEQRLQGDTEALNRARARELGDRFDRMWDFARPCDEFRALGW